MISELSVVLPWRLTLEALKEVEITSFGLLGSETLVEVCKVVK